MARRKSKTIDYRPVMAVRKSEIIYKAAALRWVDSSATRGWNAIHPDNLGVAIIDSLGWIVQEDDNMITLSASISANNNCDTPISIPKVAIIEILRLPYKMTVK